MKSRNHPVTRMFLALFGAVLIANVSLADDYSTSIKPPIRSGNPTQNCDDRPTEGEVMRALKSLGSAPATQERCLENIKITFEKLGDKVDAPRSFPLAGIAQLHHCRWKCTASFTETVAFTFPLPGKMVTRREEVVFIDKDHLHLVTESAAAPAACSECQAAREPRKEANEVALLPTDTLGFVTIHVADVMDKLGLSSRLDKTIPLKELKEQFGVSLKDVERCTMAMFDTRCEEAVIIVRLAEKPGNMKEICAQVKKKFEAIQIIDDRTLLLGSNEAALKRCGKRTSKTPESEKDCAYALSVAANHDFFAWGRLSACPANEAIALPSGIETGTLMIDIRDKLGIAIEVSCADGESADWTKKSFQAGLDMVRAQMLTVSSMLGAAELFPVVGNDSDFKKMRLLPLKLMRQAEKGIQQARIETDGTDVKLSIALPIDARMLRSEVAGLLRLMDDDLDPASFKLPAFQTRQTMTVQAPPDSVKGQCQNAPIVCTSDVGAIGTVVGAATGHPMVGTVVGCGTGAVVGCVADVRRVQTIGLPVETLPAPRPVPSPYASTMPVAMGPYAMALPATPIGSYAATPGTTTPPQPAPPQPAPFIQVVGTVQTARISIANVRKEPAMLFKMMDGGKLEFVQKVAPGEAVDVQTTTTQRWIAVFTDKPSGESFTAKSGESVWLLRAAAQPAPVPAPPMPPQVTPTPPSYPSPRPDTYPTPNYQQSPRVTPTPSYPSTGPQAYPTPNYQQPQSVPNGYYSPTPLPPSAAPSQPQTR